MTNRQWLIWQLIDMSDEEFADKYCRSIICLACPIEDCDTYSDCHDALADWLKQEHESNAI